ncbi:hypothetical protein SNOG_11336 [Paecilomyces variotii No. 5]|uniref:Tubby C-terminal-like domain-containing protein n=1 Tax=Byssochlamys spectabilis (strain No. 5 / NBRC 109023) TaxID=1356009 RepID=V5G6X5_BYSSN|nr:hypothetical protein SNOG_11336 [Paecilomyces variotii No. 5]
MASLQRWPVPVIFEKGHITKEETTLEIRCHDRFFRDAVVYDENGETIFAMEAKEPFTSWSVRRSLKDASGCHVWDLRHYKSKLKAWVMESSDGRELCTIEEKQSTTPFTAATALVPIDKGYVTISMESSDSSGIKTLFQTEGTPVAEMHLTENNDKAFLHRRNLDRTAWKLRVTEGTDIGFILGLAFCRAEISHSWRR